MPQGQWDAGASLGLSPVQELRLVILPQAFKITRAPMVGFLVQLIKSTALTSIIGFPELLRTANAINNATFEPFKVYGFVALIFFAMCYPLTRYSRYLQAPGSEGPLADAPNRTAGICVRGHRATLPKRVFSLGEGPAAPNGA